MAALPGETASLACEVDAVPVPRAFRWTFNESTALPAAAAAADLLPRVLFVTPTGPADFGDYACWPEEDGEGLGWITRGKPCVTRLLRAGESPRLLRPRPDAYGAPCHHRRERRVKGSRLDRLLLGDG